MESKNLKDLREKRKQWFSQMEQKLKETQPKEEDSLLDKTEHVPPLKTVKSVQFWS